jgi:GntR family transcriptional regulator, transcriptional repressor for pyruvate dehydrogenase complex
MPLQPVQRRSVADAVFEQLLAGVLTGELKAGSSLPAERALTDTLGVNRQAVREALQRLAQAGLVEIRHGGSTRVLDYRRTAGLELLPQLLTTPDGDADPAVVRSLMELRLCLGPEIARRCAERADTAQRAAVRAAVDAMEGLEDLVELAHLDLAFWDALVEGADNIAYRLAFNGLRHIYEPVADLVSGVIADELHDHRSRRAIAAAVDDSDGRRAAAAAGRLLSTRETA